MAAADGALEVEAIARLGFMLGRWQGPGWHVTADGRRAELVQEETVTSHLGGRLLAVDGVGHARDDPGRVVHEAFALVWFDPAAERYWWEAFSRAGRTVTALEVEDAAFRWTLDLGDEGRIRYEARFAGGTWEETGEAAAPGGGWRPMFAMALERAG